MSSFGLAERSKNNVYFAETEDLARVVAQVTGGSKTVNALYARRIASCVNACAGIPTEELGSIASTGGMLGPREDIARIAAERDELLEAMKLISSFTIPQFMGPNDMALECVTVARKAVASMEVATV